MKSITLNEKEIEIINKYKNSYELYKGEKISFRKAITHIIVQMEAVLDEITKDNRND